MLMERFDLLGLLKQRDPFFPKMYSTYYFAFFSFLLFFFFLSFDSYFSQLCVFLMFFFSCSCVVHCVIYLSKTYPSSPKICTTSDDGAKLGWIQSHGELVTAHR